MPARFARWSLIALLATSGLTPTAAAAPERDRCVILVSVDGLAGFYTDDPRSDLPTLRRLAAEGARASGMLCSFPTVTWPNHTTLVTGVPPAKRLELQFVFTARPSARCRSAAAAAARRKASLGNSNGGESIGRLFQDDYGTAFFALPRGGRVVGQNRLVVRSGTKTADIFEARDVELIERSYRAQFPRQSWLDWFDML